MSNKREIERRPFVKILDYTVSVVEFRDLTRQRLKADIIDISEDGLGLLTDYPLEPGHVLTFNSGIGHRTGVVKWCFKTPEKDYRVGLSFK